MTKPFRNNGIEGGYGTLRTQLWLLGLRRSSQKMGHLIGEKTTPRIHRTGKGFGPPVKKLPKFPTYGSVGDLLKYSEDAAPAFHGSWSCNSYMVEAGFLEMVVPPHTIYSRGHGKKAGCGAKFAITDVGRDYVRQLKAR